MAEPRKETIVHVDDREENRYIVSRMLRNAGYQVIEGRTGKEALELAASCPDLMIIDVRLPDMLGYEVCRRIKTNPRTSGIPILQLSASFVTSESKVQALESGADQYLTQPVEGPVLIASVRALLRLQRAEAASRVSAAQWQSTFDALAEGVGLLDGEGRFLRCNQTLTRLLGLRPSQLQGQEWGPLLQPVTGLPVKRFETSSRQQFESHHDNRSFRVSIDPIGSNGTGPTASVLVVVETTNEKRAEEALRATERLAATGRLAHSIAHEINNPLEAVTNLLYLLQHELKDNPRGAQYLVLAERELARVGHITKQTLAFNRDSDAPVEVSLAEVVEEVLNLYRAKIDSRSIILRRDYREAPQVSVHTGQVRQIFSNLIANSIDAVPERGTIVVRVRRSRMWNSLRAGARVVIADNGSGIKLEDKARIFEAFFTTKSQKGSGLGLWLSLGTVTHHGGTIRVRSTLRKGCSGTVVSVFLPLDSRKPPLTRAEVEPAAPGPTERRKKHR